ncbi:hypothetical protein D9M69_670980 [compost metagenome]
MRAFADDSAAALADLDQTGRLEARDRLADDRPADPETLRQHGFRGQASARQHFAVGDIGLQGRRHLIGQRALGGVLQNGQRLGGTGGFIRSGHGHLWAQIGERYCILYPSSSLTYAP